jgi:hypothetical protein
VSRAPTPGPPPLEDTTVDALQDALATEHAALWCYSLVVAFLPAEQLAQARSDAQAHRTLRGDLERILAGAGVRPASALPAYSTPQPVVDGPSAAALAVVAEADALAAWRSVLERTTDRTLRQTALTTMGAGTVRCAQWRAAVGTAPAIPTFPGRP